MTASMSPMLRQFHSPGKRDRSPNTQALLLRRRGELRQSRTGFNARLPCPSATAHPIREGDEVSRLGLQLDRSESAPRLVVTKVDENPRRRTPASQWNYAEKSQAWRPSLERNGDPEFHEPFDLRPGDRIAAVNGVCGSTAMLQELAEAMDGGSPKAVELAISRDLTQVLQPHLEEVRRVAAEAEASRAESAPLPEGPTLSWGTPPLPRRQLSPMPVRKLSTAHGRLSRPSSLPLLPRPASQSGFQEPNMASFFARPPPLPTSSTASSQASPLTSSRGGSRPRSVSSGASTTASSSFTVSAAARALRRQKRM